MADRMTDLPEAAQLYLEGRRLDEVECIISDLPGIARGKAVPASKFARQEYFHLPDSIFFQTITGDWGEAAGDDGFIEKDMILRPDMSTATAAPWTADWTLQVIHDAYDRNNKPVPYSPRNVLKRVVGLYRAQGWEPVVAPEMEFFLVARNLDPAHEIQPMMGRSGRPAAARRHGAYEPHPWIPPLEQFIRDCYAAHVPMIGVCFGHQVIAQAMGGKVEKFAGGWSVGRVVYPIEGQEYAINAWHQDQVVEKPAMAQVIGATDFCANAALLYDDRIWTIQPHPEYESDFIGGLIRHRGKGVIPDAQLDSATAALTQPLDNHAIAAKMAAFFKKERA